MKRLLTLLLLVICTAASAQIYQNRPEYGWNFQRIKITSTLHLPVDTAIRSNVLDPGAIVYQISDKSLYTWDGSKWNKITSATSLLALDSAYRSADSIIFHKTTGGTMGIKLNNIPQSGVIGMTDSLRYRWDSSYTKQRVILNQFDGPQNAKFWVSGSGRIDSGLTVNKNTQIIGGAIISAKNSGSKGGYINIGNGTTSGSFIPSIQGQIRYDTALAEETRVLGVGSLYQGTDTTGQSYLFKNARMSNGGILLVSFNEISPYLKPNPWDNVLSISIPTKNMSGDSTAKPSRSGTVWRMGGDSHVQMAGKLAVNYALTDTVGTFDKLSKMVKSFPAGLAGMFNGRVSGADGINDSDFVSIKQFAYANVKSFGAVGDGVTDDAAAFNAALATGKPVLVPTGIFLLNSTITPVIGSTIVGIGIQSVLKTTLDQPVLSLANGYCTIKDLQIIGSGRGTAVNYQTIRPSQHGVSMTGTNALKNNISNVYFKNLGGSGIYALNAVGTYHEGNQVIGCKFETCWAGIYADIRGEYNLISVPIAFNCEYGVYIRAGNNSVTGGNISNNRTGVLISSDYQNDGHCVISGTKINHSTDFSVRADSTVGGYLFDGCMMYVGKVYLNNAKGIKFTDCDLSTLDTVFANNSTKIQFVNTKWVTTPTFWLSYNGTNNTGTASDVTFFNSTWWATMPTTIVHNTLVGVTSSASVIQVSGSGGVSPTSGSGIELATGGFPLNGIVSAIDRTGAPVFIPLTIQGSVIKMNGRTLLNSTTDDGSTSIQHTGSESHSLVTTTTALTLNATHFYVNVNNSSNIIITLPTAVAAVGRTYVVKKTSNNASTVTFNTTSSQTIDGGASGTLSIGSFNAGYTFYSDGANWFIKN